MTAVPSPRGERPHGKAASQRGPDAGDRLREYHVARLYATVARSINNFFRNTDEHQIIY